VSKENAPNANWKHVRLEGAFPSRDNLKVGRYDYAVESTIQWKKSAFTGFTSSQQTFVTNFANKIKLSDSLARLSSANQQGVAALPGSSGTTAFGSGSANEIAFVSRVTRAGNSCNPFTAVK
jgi:hypothetical protein